MASIVLLNTTTPPDSDSGKSVLFTKNDGLYVVLESGTVVGPLAGPLSMVAGGALTGTYPNPGLANNAVTTTKIANGAVTGAKLDPTLIDPVAGTAGLRTLGTGAQQAAAGNDPRLSDSRAPSGAASGDLAGSYPSPVVGRIRGRLVSTAVPALNDVLTWNGTAWTPAASGGGGSAITGLTGDVTASGPGSVPATVARIQGYTVQNVAPSDGQTLVWSATNTQWEPTTPKTRELQFAFNETVVGASPGSPVHIGSVYLESGVSLQATSRAMIGGALIAEKAVLNLKRFTGGATIATFSSPGTLHDVTLGVVVAVPASDWYDVYLSETSGGTAIAKGLKLSLA